VRPRTDWSCTLYIWWGFMRRKRTKQPCCWRYCLGWKAFTHTHTKIKIERTKAQPRYWRYFRVYQHHYHNHPDPFFCQVVHHWPNTSPHSRRQWSLNFFFEKKNSKKLNKCSHSMLMRDWMMMRESNEHLSTQNLFNYCTTKLLPLPLLSTTTTYYYN